jgi:hypothetical protein
VRGVSERGDLGCDVGAVLLYCGDGEEEEEEEEEMTIVGFGFVLYLYNINQTRVDT